MAKVVYFGSAEFAVPTLRYVAPHVLLVVSQPDRPAGRGMRLQASPVKIAALKLGLPVITPERCRAPEFVEKVEAMRPDFLLVAAYGQILSERLLAAGAHGGINLHGSILPKYRGAAPIQRAIQNGEPETGISLMQMDKGLDSGDVIAIERTPIGADETYGELQDRLAQIAAALASGWLARLAVGEYPRVGQDHSLMSLAPKVAKSEARILLDGKAGAEYNRFRAFTPTPGAYIELATGSLRCHRMRLKEHTAHTTPGEVLSVAPELCVALGDGALLLLEVQPPGKGRMSGRDWANGVRLRVGDIL